MPPAQKNENNTDRRKIPAGDLVDYATAGPLDGSDHKIEEGPRGMRLEEVYRALEAFLYGSRDSIERSFRGHDDEAPKDDHVEVHDVSQDAQQPEDVDDAENRGQYQRHATETYQFIHGRGGVDCDVAILDGIVVSARCEVLRLCGISTGGGPLRCLCRRVALQVMRSCSDRRICAAVRHNV